MFRVKGSVLVGVALVTTVVALFAGGAGSSATVPVEMSFACALHSNGLMSYTISTSQCKKNETAVTIKPGPVLLCVQPGGSVRKVSSFADCSPSASKLTLPPASGTVYFCAANSGGGLRYVTSPAQCTSSEFPVFVTPNDAAPSVTSTSPANGTDHVAVNTNVTINFSESVTASTSSFTLVCGGNGKTFTVSGSPGSSITLDPTADLPQGTSCTVTAVANNISDTDTLDPPDHPSANYSFSFTTDSAPAVTSTIPADGATGVNPSNNITVNFNEPVNASGGSFTLECPTSTGKSFSVSGSGTSTITLDPSADLPNATVCRVTVLASGISDVDGGDPPDNLAANYVFSFTTTDTAPSVTSTSPADGADHVAVNSNVVVNFSESVTATGSSFTLDCPAGTPQSFTLSGSPGSSITLDPTSDLPEGTTCTVTAIASNISDTDAVDPPDHPAANYVFSFTTDSAPAVTSTSPADGATDINPSGSIAVSFNEPVTVGAGSFTLSCDGNAQSFSLSGSGTSAITIDPDSDLPTANCTVTAVAANISDTDTGDPPDHPAANYAFSFTMQDSVPSISSTSPADGATGVSIASNIVLTFSESVTANPSSFTIECPTGTAVTFTVGGSPGSTVTLDPTGNLPELTTCTVTVIASQISDVDSADPPDHPAANYVFAFTTAARPTNTSPTVVVTTPVEGGTFAFGDDIPFTVTVTDPEDGAINCSEVQVTFVLGHDTHGHAEETTAGCSGVLHTLASDVTHGGNVFGVVSAAYTDHGIGHDNLQTLTTVGQSQIRQKHQEVEFVVNQSGTNTATNNDGGPGPPGDPGVHRGSLAAGDWIQLNGPFNLTNINSITYRVADANAGRTAGSPLAAIEIHQGTLTGPIVQTDNLFSTGGTAVWSSQNFPISLLGTHELFLVFRAVTGGSTGANLFNLNWLEFQGAGIGTPP